MPVPTYQEAFTGGGVPVPISAGSNSFSDGDGVTRYHGLNVTPKRQQAGPQTQTGLATATLSTPIIPTTATGGTLFVTVSVAGTVTIWLNSLNGGAYYQLYSDTGAAISLTMTAGQAIAIPIPACNAVAIEWAGTGTTSVTLETCGWVAG